MNDHLNSEEDDLLQSALSSAFTPADLPRQSVASRPAEPETPTAPAPPSQELETSASTGEPESAESVWKEEYETHVAEWRRRSAEQREKAEEERARWEAIRAKEQEEGKARENEWESLGSSVTSTAASVSSPSPADARDLVSGESQAGHPEGSPETGHPRESSEISTPRSNERPNSEPDSSKHEKWDDIASSLTSSFPSMSFPSDPHSPVSYAPHLPRHQDTHLHARAAAGRGHHGHQPDHPAAERRTATISVFDTTLSTRTRVLALASSLAINLLLPFINGVMLGFGEIFARNVVVKWFGWKVPSVASAAEASRNTATKLGLGKSRK